MENEIIIDADTYQQLKDQVGADFVIELIDAYAVETADLIDRLQQALAGADAAVFGRMAHSIKTSSASLGALAFAQQARELEMMGRANDLAEARPKVEQLTTAFPKVVSRLTELKNEP